MNNRLEAGGCKPAIMMGTRAQVPASLRAPLRVACVQKRHSLGGRLVAGVLQKGKEQNMNVLRYIEHVFSAMDSKEAIGLGGLVEENGDQSLSEETSEGTVTVLPLPLASSLAASTLLPEVQQDDVYRQEDFYCRDCPSSFKWNALGGSFFCWFLLLCLLLS